MRDIYNNINIAHALNPQTATTTKTSSAIDLLGYNSACVLFVLGASGDTLSGSVYWTLKLQHSDDDSSYSDVTLADLVGNTAATTVVDSAGEAQQTYKFGYNGSKRYLKGVATHTGTHTNGTPMTILGLRGTASLSPVA
jgi:hypothetical protein